MSRILKRYDYAVQRLLAEMWLSLPELKKYPRQRPQSGDLVMLFCAPQTEWHLSIYIELLPDGRHLLESLKTGALCNWDNVDVTVISREWVDDNPRVKWTDEQFNFSRKVDAESRRFYHRWYLYAAFIKEFSSASVVLGVRTKYGINSERTYSLAIAWNDMTRAEIRCLLHELLRVQINRSRAKRNEVQS